jgi:hypothetical protein
MKRSTVFATVLSLLLVAGSVFAGDTTQKYEVVCMKCLAHHTALGDGGGHGTTHAACAMKCSTKGVDLGLMDSKGNVYLPINQDFESARDVIKDKAGDTIELTGTVIKTKGVNYLQLADTKAK